MPKHNYKFRILQYSSTPHRNDERDKKLWNYDESVLLFYSFHLYVIICNSSSCSNLLSLVKITNNMLFIIFYSRCDCLVMNGLCDCFSMTVLYDCFCEWRLSLQPPMLFVLIGSQPVKHC